MSMSIWSGSTAMRRCCVIVGVAVVLAMINVIGGYAVTDRMLLMFRKEEKR